MRLRCLWIILLAAVGIIAAVFGFEYLTVGIGHLPRWVPGHVAHKRGHLHERGSIAEVIDVAPFAGAGFVLCQEVQADRGGQAVKASAVN